MVSAGDPDFFDVMYPVSMRASASMDGRGRPLELLGYVRTGMIAGDWGRAMASTLDLVVGVGVLALLAAVPLGFLVIRRIVAPLDGLADVIVSAPTSTRFDGSALSRVARAQPADPPPMMMKS